MRLRGRLPAIYDRTQMQYRVSDAPKRVAVPVTGAIRLKDYR
jgi:hypothetical protein